MWGFGKFKSFLVSPLRLYCHAVNDGVFLEQKKNSSPSRP
jgi:hypothetical protein